MTDDVDFRNFRQMWKIISKELFWDEVVDINGRDIKLRKGICLSSGLAEFF